MGIHQLRACKGWGVGGRETRRHADRYEWVYACKCGGWGQGNWQSLPTNCNKEDDTHATHVGGWANPDYFNPNIVTRVFGVLSWHDQGVGTTHKGQPVSPPPHPSHTCFCPDPFVTNSLPPGLSPCLSHTPVTAGSCGIFCICHI